MNNSIFSLAVDGNTVRKLPDPEAEERRERRRIEREKAQKLRENNLRRMQKQKKLLKNKVSTLTKLFWVGAIVIVFGVIISYLDIKDENIRSTKKIAEMESQLINLKQKNDDNKNRIDGEIDLEEVRRIAIYELGMQYADKGQVVTYKENGGDYVTQFREIPKNGKPDKKPARPGEKPEKPEKPEEPAKPAE